MLSSMLMTFLLTSFAFLSTTLPIPQANFPPPPADTQFYHLKAQTLPESSHPEFDNLYLSSYHTGAGLSDVTFDASATSSQGFLNGTNAQFNLSSLSNGFIPWSMIMTSEEYSTFSPVEINVGLGEGTYGAFYFNQTANGSLWWNSQGNSTDPYYGLQSNGFAGWIACDWVHHDIPQLFWLQSYYASRDPLPSNCAPIYLVPEYET